MKDLSRFSRVLQSIFWLLVVVHAGAVVSQLMSIAFLIDIQDGLVPEDADIATHDQRETLVTGVESALFLLCAVVFCFWFARAVMNVHVGRVRPLNYEPKWAVLGFIIPVLNLVRPYQVMSEVWTGSAYLASDRRRSQTQLPVHGLVNWWWGLFILGLGLERVSEFLVRAAEELDQFLLAGKIQVAAEITMMSAAYVALRLVGAVWQLQEVICKPQSTPSKEADTLAGQAHEALEQARLMLPKNPRANVMHGGDLDEYFKMLAAGRYVEAFHDLEGMGATNSVRAEYWETLLLAAQALELEEQAERYVKILRAV